VVHFKPSRAPIPPSKGSPSHAGGRSDQYSSDIPAAGLMVKGDRAKVPRAIQFGQLNQQGLSLSTLEDCHLRPKPALFLQHGICNPLLQPIALTLKALLFGLRNANIRILTKLHHPFTTLPRRHVHLAHQAMVDTPRTFAHHLLAYLIDFGRLSDSTFGSCWLGCLRRRS